MASGDGDGGYPGNLNVTVTYTSNNDNALTNHSYFNLSGDLKRTVHNHEITMDSRYFVELDQNLIPTGKKLDVSVQLLISGRTRSLQKDLANRQNKPAGMVMYTANEDGLDYRRAYPKSIWVAVSKRNVHPLHYITKDFPISF